jgi:predicted RNA-binding Zn-ribbon protein involved in translation (DUF1610 family)
MKCPFCDANISEQSFFCPDCGKKIPRCPRCGRWYDANTKFCPKDGTKIEQDDVWNQEEVIRTVKQGKPDENDNRVSKKKVVIIIIVAVAIVAMGFLLVKAGMFLKKGNKGTSQYDNGDYVYSPLDKNISYDEDKYTVYYNNMLMAYLTENISEEEASEMAGSVDGELVGYISGCMNAIQIKVEETDLKGLESLADNLMESENVIYATFDFPISMDEEDVTNPWEDADEHNEINYNANEDNPDGNDWWAEAIGAYTAWNIVDSGDMN